MSRYSATMTLLLMLLAPAAVADTIGVPQDQPTIQDAVTTAADGDTILVAAGTYVENVDLQGKIILLTSADGPEATIIDGGQAGSVITISAPPAARAPGEGETAVIEGFTITNGLAENGGGIAVTDAGVLITGNVISGNSAGYSGGGIDLIRGVATVTGNLISANNAVRRGGGFYAAASSVVFTGNDVRDNFTDDPYTSAGGGVYFDDHTYGEISSNAVTGNTSVGGGGVAVRLYSSALVADNLIDGNHGLRHGGGIATKLYCSAILVGNTITNNLGDRMGGGVYIRKMNDVVLLSNEITNNSSALGGGVWINQSSPEFRGNLIEDNEGFTSGGGVMANETSTPVFSGDRISGNFAPLGGALRVADESSATLDGVMVTGNLATQSGDGAGIAVTETGSVAQLTNCLMAENTAEGNGGAISVSGGSAWLLNNTIAGNSATGSGGGLMLAEGAAAVVTNSILWDNGSDLAGGDATVSYSLVEDGVMPGPGNLSANPMFYDQLGGDFGLTASSPGIDSGFNDEAPAADREGDPRPMDGDGDLVATADMGFDEYVDPPLQRLHVSGTTMSSVFNEAQQLYNILAHVTVVDAAGLPVADAMVTAEMIYPNGQSRVRSGRTNADGLVTMAIRSRRTGLFRTLVGTVSLDGWVHDQYADGASGAGHFIQ